MSPYAARPPMGQRDSAARVKRLFSAAAFQLQIDRVRAGIHRHWNEPILTAVRFRDQFRDVGTIRCLVCRRDPYVVLPNESAGFRGIELQLVVAILVGFRRRRSPLRLRFKRNERVRNRLAVQRNLSRNPAQFRTEAKNNRGAQAFRRCCFPQFRQADDKTRPAFGAGLPTPPKPPTESLLSSR